MEANNQNVTKGRLSLSRDAELPIDGLPQSIREYINAVCNIYHCPQEFVTVAVWATAATAVGRKIRINEGKYQNSLVLWFVLVARSGSNKSYPIKLATRPLREIDAELYQLYKMEYTVWKSVPQKEREGDEPKCPGIIVDDCTDERRSEILYINSLEETGANRGAIGIYPELKGMFDSKNMYQNGGTAGISKLLRLFDCEDIKVDRRNGLTMLIRNPHFNILGDLQTGMLRSTFGSELFMTNGLNQRFLFCMAEDIDYPKRNHAKLPREISARWRQTIRMLYENIYHCDGTHTTLFRSIDGQVSLSESADKLYEEYYNRLQEKKQLAQNDYEASIYSKLQIQVLRLAGIVHILEIAEAKGERADYNILREATMEYAIRCMDYFEEMAKRVYQKLLESPAEKSNKKETKADHLLAVILDHPDIPLNRIAKCFGYSAAYLSHIKKRSFG